MEDHTLIARKQIGDLGAQGEDLSADKWLQLTASTKAIGTSDIDVPWLKQVSC